MNKVNARCWIIALVILTGTSVFAQNGSNGNVTPGYLCLGVRNSVSVFTIDKKAFWGTSVGGQFAIRLSEGVNTHWFGDFITSNVNNVARRMDIHGGFSVMPEIFSANKSMRVAPYPLAGFCIDYTKMDITTGIPSANSPRYLERYSFAAQLGAGMRIPVTQRLDVSFESHYMLHIGTDLDIEINGSEVELVQRKGTSLEGHFLFAISMDYKLFRLWGRK